MFYVMLPALSSLTYETGHLHAHVAVSPHLKLSFNQLTDFHEV
jgi:hypothetical protein